MAARVTKIFSVTSDAKLKEKKHIDPETPQEGVVRQQNSCFGTQQIPVGGFSLSPLEGASVQNSNGNPAAHTQ